jgi:hypothetical protein
MVNSASQRTQLEFQGKKPEQKLAELVLGLFQSRGAFFASDAPITLTLVSLTEALTSMGESATEAAIERALDANAHIFVRDDSNDETAFVTTKSGVPPDGTQLDADTHDLMQRFATPEPIRERARPRSAVDSFGSDSIVSEKSAPMEFPPDSWQAAVAAALREAGQESPDVILPDGDGLSSADFFETLGAAVEQDVEAAVSVDEEVEELLLEEPAISDERVAEVEAAPAIAPVEPAPAAVAEIEIDDASDADIAEAIELALREEPGAVRWGDLWMDESNVPVLSKDDLNKIQVILGSASEAVSDYALVRDVGTNQTPGSEEFEIERFALNYRMSRELGMFEFVGSARQSLWAPSGSPAITTEKRKASEIGQDYRFLLDYKTPDAELEPGLIEHVLTFYEHRLGILPLNANFATIMPKAAFNDQRVTRLTFESPQTFETFEVEVRYPTSNRGGYLIGFEEFFAENLVPGAVVTIEATRDRETHFIVEYFQISRQDRKLLQFNERRERFVFQSTTYFCATQDDMLLDDNHFARLADVSPLDEESRRHVDKVLRATFERVGARLEEDDELRYRAHIVDILAAANIERPISEPYLRDILLGGAYPEFIPDDSEEDVFLYVAPAS